MMLTIAVFTLCLSFFHVVYIRKFTQLHLKYNIVGVDYYKYKYMNQVEKIVECMGLPIYIYFFSVLFFLDFFFIKLIDEHWLQILLICSINCLIGFLDYFFPLKWRYKIMLPILTQFIFGYKSQLNLDSFFQNLLIGILTCFSLNSINIYAGVQGIEVGQTLIIVFCFIVDNMVNNQYENQEDFYINIFLFFILLSFTIQSFVGSKIFIGDVFCFVFGTLIVHLKFRQKEKRDILFFFIPQLINFVLSLPQILGFKNCPWHRLPILDKRSLKLKTSFPRNFTLINFYLKIRGPQFERKLSIQLLQFQLLVNVIWILLKKYVLKKWLANINN